jgi:hypothetical protein
MYQKKQILKKKNASLTQGKRSKINHFTSNMSVRLLDDTRSHTANEENLIKMTLTLLCKERLKGAGIA